MQEEIEKPFMYIMARCRSNDEQLAYTETRLDCVKDLEIKSETSKGYEITDKIKFGKADGPIVQFETGNQKGGNYFCPCGIEASKVHE